MMFSPCRKATLLVPSGPAHDPERYHLFVILTDPAGQPALVLTVSISSVRPGSYHDVTCILQPGDHAFIHHASWVDYSRAEIMLANKLASGVRAQLMLDRGLIADAVFERIVTGVLTSARTPLKAQNYLRTLQ